MGFTESTWYFLPELVLVATLFAVLAADLLAREKEWTGPLALTGVVLSLLFVGLRSGAADAWLFHRMIVHDRFATFFKVIFALAVAATVWMSLGSRELRRVFLGEYYGLLLASTIGMYAMASAANLLMAYLSLELVSLTSYVLTGCLRHDRRSGEAALKYLIYGGVASATMIYGMSWLFGLTGSMDYTAIRDSLASSRENAPAVFIALTLCLAGFGYKIAAVPLHMWAPDVYTGAPIPIAAFLSVASKAAGFALLLRFFYPGLSSLSPGGEWAPPANVDWRQLMLIVSMVTMTLGNLAALQQENLKRLLAYSSIAHAGYMLMGFVTLTDEGLRSVLFYLVTYYLMNLGAFLGVMIVANSTEREDLEGLRGLAWRGGAAPAVALAVFLFSLAGIPPLAGFVGKFYLFAAVIREELYVLALVGVLNSVVSLYYYARVVRTMFLDFPAGGERPVTLDWSNGSLLGILVVLTLVLGVYWAPVKAVADRSVQFLGG